MIHYETAMNAEAEAASAAAAPTTAPAAALTTQPAAEVAADLPTALIEHPAGLLATLLVVLAGIFWLTQHPVFGRIFKVIPALVFCYFVPTTLTTFGVIPAESEFYRWVKAFVLPACLLLLILSLDVPAIIRLGPKAVIMLLAGTAGVVIGGPVSLLLCSQWLPDDIWQGMTALSGSWIGGGANFLALGEMAGTSSKMMALMVVPDVFIASVWMAVLLYLSGHQHRIDKWTGANASAIRDLERRMTDFQERVNRIPSVPDLFAILAFGFMGTWASYRIGVWLPDIGKTIDSGTWKYIIVTALGVSLSFTRVRNLEGAGASKIGTVMIYLLVACIGASADFASIIREYYLIPMCAIWMACHVIVLLGVGRLIRAPLLFVAVGSQANIGGAASAPVVAAAFHPSLAPVGALLAVAGYVLGTYAGWMCMIMLMRVAGASAAVPAG